MGSNDDRFLDRFAPITVRERRGPHWRQDGKLYFVTWRQADSIPREVRERIVAERAGWLKRHGEVPFAQLPEGTKRTYWRLFAQSMQKYLDAGYGSCVLRHPEAARIMADALHYFKGTRYDLGTFAIAANHVHVIVAPKPGIDLSEVQHSWKSFTANRINRLLSRSGTLWRPECYDRIVRNERGLRFITNYILAHRKGGHYVEHLPI